MLLTAAGRSIKLLLGNPNCALNGYHNICEKTAAGDLLEKVQLSPEEWQPQYLV